MFERLPPEEAFQAYLEELRRTEDLDEEERRAERVEPRPPLRAVIDGERRELGRMTSVSSSALWVEARSPFKAQTGVLVELCVLGGYALELRGTVVKSGPSGMGIRLETDDSTRVFRSSFVELAARPGPRRPEVRIRARPLDVAADRDALAPLWRAWREAEQRLGDDDRQQRFIHACLGARRLDFALERYRAARMAQPGRGEPERYLVQVGTLIGFSGLAPTDREEVRTRGRVLRAVATGILLLMVGLVAARWVGTSKVRARPSLAPHDARGPVRGPSSAASSSEITGPRSAPPAGRGVRLRPLGFEPTDP